MGQSFREQLAQSTALAQRVVTKISGSKRGFSTYSIQVENTKNKHSSVVFLGDRTESFDDKTATMLALRWGIKGFDSVFPSTIF